MVMSSNFKDNGHTTSSPSGQQSRHLSVQLVCCDDDRGPEIWVSSVTQTSKFRRRRRCLRRWRRERWLAATTQKTRWIFLLKKTNTSFFRWNKILSCHSWHWRGTQVGFARPMPVVISSSYRIAAVLCPPESVIQTRRVSYKLFVPVSVGCGWFSIEPARFYEPWLKKQSADQWVSLLTTDYGP